MRLELQLQLQLQLQPRLVAVAIMPVHMQVPCVRQIFPHRVAGNAPASERVLSQSQ